MNPSPPKTRKGLTGYFWLMVFFYALLAIGLAVLVAGLLHPEPPRWVFQASALL